MKESCCTKLTKFLVKYVIPVFMVPVLIFLAPIYRIRDSYIFRWRQARHVTTPAEHRKRVADVQKQVQAWNAAGRPRPMCTARKAWNTVSVMKRDKRQLAQIDLSALNCLVEVDETNGVLTVEPDLMMGQLTSILADRGWDWTIPVIPEIDALTVGGVICGAGLESSSGRYGMMGETPVGYELVLSSGEVVNASREEYPDLFYSIPWSHGTIAFLTAVKFPMVKAGKYVQLEYYPTNSLDEAQRLLENQDHMFVEGLQYGREKFAVMHGDLVDLPPSGSRLGPVNNLNRWYKAFFYQHAKSFLNKSRTRRQPRDPEAAASARPYTEYIPTRHYYHRHSRAAFWGGPIMSPLFATRPFVIVFGWFFPMLDTSLVQRMVLPLLSTGAYSKIRILINMIEDYVVPMKHLRASLQFVHEEVGCYPLWLCPAKVFNTPGMAHTQGGPQPPDSELYIDIGVYGNASKEAMPRFDFEGTLRKFEVYFIEKNGYIGTYGDMHLSREQWHQMFDMTLYEKVRASYGCEDAFPEVYDKVIKNAIRPL